MKLLRAWADGKGITLIEVLLVIGILAVIFSAGAPVAYNFYYQSQFESEYSLLYSVLEQARGLAMINRNESDHGVYVNSENLVVFQGSSFAARNADQDRSFPRSEGITINGPAEVVFAALSGTTASSTYTVTDNGLRSRDVYLNSEGLVYEPNY